VEACRDAGVIIALVRGSDMDPTTPAGRLVVQGVRVARKRVWRLMRAAGLQGRHPKPWKRTTIAGQRPIDAADLIGRDFTAEQPNTRRGSAARSDRAGQHRGAPAHRPRRAAVDPPGPRCPAPAHGLRHDLPVRPNGGRALPPTAVPGRPHGAARPLPHRLAAPGVDDFVADIPLESGHLSRAPFDAVAARLEEWRTCPRWCCGARATRCSPTSTYATCSTACHTPRCTATRPHRTWSPRTAVLVRPRRPTSARRPGHLVRRRRRCGSGWGVVDSVWYCMARVRALLPRH
jgi:hypothetical protein